MALLLQNIPGVMNRASVAGNGADFYNPTFFGNPGQAVVDRFNRLFVGQAVNTSSDVTNTGLASKPGWLDTLINEPVVTAAAFAAISPLGDLAIVGASRSSDFRTFGGFASGGTQGLLSVGVNDDTGSGAPIAVGAANIGIHQAGVNGITVGNQLDMNSALASVVDITPAVGVTAGITIAGLLTSGAFPSVGTSKVSAALVIENGRAGGPAFRKGVVFINGGLDSGVGAGGAGVYLEAYDGMSQRWLNSSNATIAEIWATNAFGGLLINAAKIEFANSANFVANGASGATLANVPAGVTTASAKWLTFYDNGGNQCWVPVWT